MENILPQPRKRHLIPLTEWPQKEGYPPLGTLRDKYFHRNSNGFDKVTVRCGRRILIDRDLFYAWLDEQNGGVK